MDEYKRLYLLLFNSVTGALEALGRGEAAAAEELLRQAQIRAEELFIAGED